MAKIVFLGTSSSIPSKERDHTSLLLIQARVRFLIDSPGAIVHKLYKIGINYTSINKIILTHTHPDHVYGITHLIHSQMKVNKEITVFCHRNAIRKIRKLVAIMNLNKKIYPSLRYIDVFEKEFFYTSGGIRLGAVKNKHSNDSFGVKGIFAKNSFLYSSDTALHPAILREARTVTFLIHDCTASSHFFSRHPSLYSMHTSAYDLAHTFKESPVKKVIPIHFLFLPRGEEQRVRKELKPLGKKLLIPMDFDVLTL